MGPVNFPWQLMEAARHAVIILYEHFDIPDEQRYDIFKHAFLEDAQTLRPGTDIKMYSLSDAYNCRLRSDRKPWWITHDGDRPNGAERARRNAVRATALVKLQTAAYELGIVNATKANTAVASGEHALSANEDVMERAVIDGDDIGSFTGAEIVPDVTEAESHVAPIQRDNEQQDEQRAVGSSELGRFASWPMADLLDGMSIHLEKPEYSDLLQFCRTHAKKRKLSIVQYLERRLNQAGSKRAKVAQQSGRLALASPDGPEPEDRPYEREVSDDMSLRIPDQRKLTKRKSRRRNVAEAGLTRPSQRLSPLSERILNMVHHCDCTWQDTSPSCPAGTFVDSADEVYKTGGKVFRTFINDKLEDVMICQPSICNYCTPGKDNAGASIADAAPSSRESATHVLNGLPFVHNGDVTLNGRGMPRYFKGTSSGWSPVFPKDMYQSVVDFTVDGETVEKVAVMACYARNCDSCTSKMTVDAEVVDYRPVSRANKRQKVGVAEG
ncbi:hypothetical protein B0A54_06142 [Friedmanniomyces endolithicus]|uniref:Uncharacterized protein n=1 Tax=Friedmanniomyces endolithicus TaxID=329885 RepID=A0A4U0V4G3_9PEZI|nr:hypothetical protein LTS09_006844 [Friedmanniomyces endolithicus]TKA43192.1 hypothetical protein B0A54_06142 [Friedmanniomyces endolithicus]